MNRREVSVDADLQLSDSIILDGQSSFKRPEKPPFN